MQIVPSENRINDSCSIIVDFDYFTSTGRKQVVVGFVGCTAQRSFFKSGADTLNILVFDSLLFPHPAIAMDTTTLVFIKPDMAALGLVPELRVRINAMALTINYIGTVQFDLQSLQTFYQWKQLFDPAKLEEYLCSSALPLWLVTGEDACAKLMSIKTHMRTNVGARGLKTLFHSSASVEDFEREYAIIIRCLRR